MIQKQYKTLLNVYYKPLVNNISTIVLPTRYCMVMKYENKLCTKQKDCDLEDSEDVRNSHFNRCIYIPQSECHIFFHLTIMTWRSNVEVVTYLEKGAAKTLNVLVKGFSKRVHLYPANRLHIRAMPLPQN